MGSFDQVGTEGMFWDVVRWGAREPLVTSLHLQQVPIGDPGVEVEDLITQLSVQEVNQLLGLLAADVSGRVVNQLFAIDANEVAAHGQLTGKDFHPHAGCFQHTSSLKDGREVVTQHREVGNLTPGCKSVGDGVQQPVSSHSGKQVHIGGLCCLQRCFVSQGRNWLVGHSIAQNDDGFMRHFIGYWQ